MDKERIEKKPEEKTKKKASDIILGGVVVLIVIGFIVGVLWVFLRFFDGNEDSGETEETVSLTEVEKTINKNLDIRYPETPTAVVKLYGSITKGVHSEDVTDEQIEELIGQMRKLFDEALLDNNEYNQHLKRLKEEIELYKEEKTSIVRYAVEDLNDIKYYVDDAGVDCTKVKITYSLKQNSEWMKQTEQVILKKDEEGLWKIFGWEKAVSEEGEE